MTSAVSVQQISKRYRLGSGGGYRRLTESLSSVLRRGRTSGADELWALRDVSFEVTEGEVVGIIGRNGAGKSTLLKILSRITEPTSGRATLHGRVGSLLEVGTGFHPELTGRENIFLNGAILGMRRVDIARRFDEIAAFAEVDRFLDTPVKRYSSGMYVRLAFAVAAHLEPEILVVDEVLAVGDAAFQKKCLGKMGDVARSGRTVLFVSHNMAAVRSLCSRGIVLDRGTVALDDTATQAIDLYLRQGDASSQTDLRQRLDRGGDGPIRVTDLRVLAEGDTGPLLGHPLTIELDFESDQAPAAAQFQIGVYDLSNVGIYLLDSDVHRGLESVPARGTVRCTTGPLQITPGRCYVNIAVRVGGGLSDHIERAAEFEVGDADPWGHGRTPPREWVLCDIPQRWEVLP